MELTPEQRRIADHSEGHAKVVAVAGSGKTQTMAEFVANAVAGGTPARLITVCMFNVDAAKEFAARLAASARASRGGLPEVKTLNAIGERLTRRFEDLSALPRRRLETHEGVIEGMARTALKEVLTRHELSVPPSDLLDDFLLFIDLVKSDIVSPDETFDAFGQFSYGEFVEAFERFEALRKQRGLRTYADQIWEPVRAIRDRPELLRGLENRIDLVVVDEFQDVSPVQLELIRIMVGNRARIMVVGDVDQSIYAWRGARPDILLKQYDRHFPCRHYRLSRTFRYGHRLALFADHVIRHNREREDTFCVSAPGTPDTTVSLHEVTASDPTPIVRIIREWQAAGRSLTDIAVLFRLRAQTAILSLHLLNAGIEFRLNGIPFVLELGYIDALIGLLELVAGTLLHEGNERRIANLLALPPPGIEREALERAGRQAIQERSLKHLKRLTPMVRHDYARRRFDERLHWLLEAPRRLRGRSAAEVIDTYVREHEIFAAFDRLSARPSTADEKKMLVASVIAFFREQRAAPEAALQIAEALKRRGKESASGVLLTTVHRAKGLEWPVVILGGLEDGVFPYDFHPATMDLEAERRLFYVAVTRARDHLHLVVPEEELLRKAVAAQSARVPPLSQIKASRFVYEGNAGCPTRSRPRSLRCIRSRSRRFPPTRIPIRRTAISRRYCRPSGRPPSPDDPQARAGMAAGRTQRSARRASATSSSATAASVPGAGARRPISFSMAGARAGSCWTTRRTRCWKWSRSSSQQPHSPRNRVEAGDDQGPSDNPHRPPGRSGVCLPRPRFRPELQALVAGGSDPGAPHAGADPGRHARPSGTRRLRTPDGGRLSRLRPGGREADRLRRHLGPLPDQLSNAGARRTDRPHLPLRAVAPAALHAPVRAAHPHHRAARSRAGGHEHQAADREGDS
jgi:DNA helicase-2/ATP-dependent DNA helicase PcrA